MERAGMAGYRTSIAATMVLSPAGESSRSTARSDYSVSEMMVERSFHRGLLEAAIAVPAA
jgi:hypothetical protein